MDHPNVLTDQIYLSNYKFIIDSIRVCIQTKNIIFTYLSLIKAFYLSICLMYVLLFV